MLRLTLRRARSDAGRLAAAGVAIVLGTAFVTAVLLTTALLDRTVRGAVSASYAGVDVVVTAEDGAPLGDDALRAVRALPGVAGADGRASAYVELAAAGGTEFGAVGGVPSVPALQPDLLAGALPTGTGEVALHRSIADRLHVGVGDGVTVRASRPAPEGPPTELVVPVRVVGVLGGAVELGTGTGAVLAAPADVLAWSGGPQGGGYTTLLVVGVDGRSPEQLREEVAAALGGAGTVVRTVEEESARAAEALLRDTQLLTAGALAFAALALFVAGLVIANTLAVLIAQRTRELALLRCVGATAGQVRVGVLVEALVLGLLASLVGVLVGAGLVGGAAAVLARTQSAVPVPATVPVAPLGVLVPIALGSAVTVLAALVPARAATRVDPLVALRPAAAPDLAGRAGRLRLVAAIGLVAAGAALLAGGVRAGTGGAGAGLLLAVPGAALSFLGVLLGAVFLVPRTVAVLGRAAALAGGGGVARLATAGAVRNPRRTATTAGALLIGVTLVATTAVGAATTRAALDTALDTGFPTDLVVGRDPAPVAAPDPAPAAPPAVLGPEAAAAVADVDGLAEVVPLRSARVGGGEGGTLEVTVLGVDPDRGRAVVADRAGLAPLAPGVAVVPREVAVDLGLEPGADSLVLTAGGATLALRAEVTALQQPAVVVSEGDLARLAPQAPTTQLWASLDADVDPGAVLADVRAAVTAATGASGATVPVDGDAATRAEYAELIDAVLLTVTALLAIAVATAVVGVANTLSLSVLERTRESALLRALGLTRGRLRAVLAVEGVLLAGVGALLGTVLGTVYGWAGTAALLGSLTDGPPDPVVPWTGVGAVLAAAVAAGLLASVLPARRAARTPPALALAG